MPALFALLLATAVPALVHRVLPGNAPFLVKAFLDFFLFIFVFYLIYRRLSGLRPDTDK